MEVSVTPLGKDYSTGLWRQLRPAAERPFALDPDITDGAEVAQ